MFEAKISKKWIPVYAKAKQYTVFPSQKKVIW